MEAGASLPDAKTTEMMAHLDPLFCNTSRPHSIKESYVCVCTPAVGGDKKGLCGALVSSCSLHSETDLRLRLAKYKYELFLHNIGLISKCGTLWPGQVTCTEGQVEPCDEVIPSSDPLEQEMDMH